MLLCLSWRNEFQSRLCRVPILWFLLPIWTRHTKQFTNSSLVVALAEEHHTSTSYIKRWGEHVYSKREYGTQLRNWRIRIHFSRVRMIQTSVPTSSSPSPPTLSLLSTSSNIAAIFFYHLVTMSSMLCMVIQIGWWLRNLLKRFQYLDVEGCDRLVPKLWLCCVGTYSRKIVTQ